MSGNTLKTMPTRLPQEIIEKIVDNINDDSSRTKNLKSFCLVAKAWLPRSRFHLFRRLRVIISQIDADALENLLQVLLRDTKTGHSCLLLPATEFVQELHVSDPFRTRARMDESEDHEARSILPTVIRVLHALPRLHTLVLDAQVCAEDYQLIGAPLPILLTLKHLALSVDADIRSMLPFVASISILSVTAPMNIERPAMRAGIITEHDRVKVDTAVITARVLRSEYVSVLRELGSLVAITHLKVECDMMTDWIALGSFLRTEALADNVRTITIDMRHCSLHASMPNFASVDLSGLRRLDSLVLQGLSTNFNSRWPDGLKFATAVLNAWSPTPQLRQLRLDFLFQAGLTEIEEYLTHSMDKDWMQLEGSLLSWGFSLDVVLEARCFWRKGDGHVIPGPIPQNLLQRTVKAKMPALFKRGSVILA